MKKKNRVLLLAVFVACIALAGVNFYSIKALAGLRAYISGESEYSKGQKDATLYLSTYIQTKDAGYWKEFERAIQVPIGDNIARVSMLSSNDDSAAIRGFLAARNQPGDIANMIWVFRTFRSVSYMKGAIEIWTSAEPLINQLNAIGRQVHQLAERNMLTPDAAMLAVKQINELSVALSLKESSFSQLLGGCTRKINTYLLIFDVICISLILGCISWYAVAMIKRLRKSEDILTASNQELNNINSELDTFVFSASHDLRSPIASLKGLIEIMKMEQDPIIVRQYMGIMETVIDKQALFINEIISFFKNKRASISYKVVSLSSLIDEVIAANKFSPEARGIVITRQIAIDEIYSDELRLKMILNNLVSNAIKYSDELKPVRTMTVKTTQQHGQINIEVEDNGIGIQQEFIDRIFEIFFVAPNARNGSGLGLYILKQNVDKLKGTINVQSDLRLGSRFTITLPANSAGVLAAG